MVSIVVQPLINKVQIMFVLLYIVTTLVYTDKYRMCVSFIKKDDRVR